MGGGTCEGQGLQIFFDILGTTTDTVTHSRTVTAGIHIVIKPFACFVRLILHSDDKAHHIIHPSNSLFILFQHLECHFCNGGPYWKGSLIGIGAEYYKDAEAGCLLHLETWPLVEGRHFFSHCSMLPMHSFDRVFFVNFQLDPRVW